MSCNARDRLTTRIVELTHADWRGWPPVGGVGVRGDRTSAEPGAPTASRGPACYHQLWLRSRPHKYLRLGVVAGGVHRDDVTPSRNAAGRTSPRSFPGRLLDLHEQAEREEREDADEVAPPGRGDVVDPVAGAVLVAVGLQVGGRGEVADEVAEAVDGEHRPGERRGDHERHLLDLEGERAADEPEHDGEHEQPRGGVVRVDTVAEARVDERREEDAAGGAHEKDAGVVDGDDERADNEPADDEGDPPGRVLVRLAVHDVVHDRREDVAANEEAAGEHGRPQQPVAARGHGQPHADGDGRRDARPDLQVARRVDGVVGCRRVVGAREAQRQR